jgi:putative membrane protein
VQVIGARPHGWRVEGDVLHVRDGWFSQDHWLLPLASIQSISLRTGPLQRRIDLATVAIDSAGAPAGGLRIRNLATADARALVEYLRAWRRPDAPRRTPDEVFGPQAATTGS